MSSALAEFWDRFKKVADRAEDLGRWQGRGKELSSQTGPIRLLECKVPTIKLQGNVTKKLTVYTLQRRREEHQSRQGIDLQ